MFWDVRGIIHVDIFEKSKSNNGECNVNLFHSFNHAKKEKRLYLAKKRSFIFQILFQCTDHNVRFCINFLCLVTLRTEGGAHSEITIPDINAPILHTRWIN